jgi:hypothetical protein
LGICQPKLLATWLLVQGTAKFLQDGSSVDMPDGPDVYAAIDRMASLQHLRLVEWFSHDAPLRTLQVMLAGLEHIESLEVCHFGMAIKCSISPLMPTAEEYVDQAAQALLPCIWRCRSVTRMALGGVFTQASCNWRPVSRA